ncbi:MAG: cobyric acid synthase [Proteobacteria bacterium]|nr:cobyric acid synthase [Pseudomonadota bacterium]
MTNQSARCVSILGTGSDVGKSIVAAALCRIFRDEGFEIAPFKAQNMSNNSSVTDEGGEMGRAQVVQAQAAGITPHVDMNPVLLKPSSNVGSQVILQGKPLYNIEARDYFRNTDELFQKSLESLERLRSQYELIIIEGAGSCGEVNLRQRDFVNFKTAHAADAPVILVADIDRGGVFAQLIGTLAVIPEKDKKRVKGFIINRFRGDPTLFDEGITYLEENTGLPVLGLVPYFDHIKIDSEDSVLLECLVDPKEGPAPGKANIAVLRFPHISNFTDFLPLENDSQVNLHYLQQPRSLVDYDIVLLPGSKNVRADLRWIKSGGWDRSLREFAERGGEIGGICGGYQILGISISDPQGVEDLKGEDEGLGMLPLKTIMNPQKTLSRSVGTWITSGDPIEGYEIHVGKTELTGKIDSLIQLQSRNDNPTADCDGAISTNGKIWGTYFHGLFNNKTFRQRFLKRLCSNYQPDLGQPDLSISEFRNRQYNLLAAHFRKHLNLEKLKSVIGI